MGTKLLRYIRTFVVGLLFGLALVFMLRFLQHLLNSQYDYVQFIGYGFTAGVLADIFLIPNKISKTENNEE